MFTPRRRTSTPASVSTPLRELPQFDFGGALAQVVPTLNTPFVPVQRAGPLILDQGTQTDTVSIDKNLGKLDDDVQKMWQASTANLDLLPEDKRYLNDKREGYLQNVYQMTMTNPAFFQNKANIAQVKEGLRQIVDSDEVSIMKQRAADARKFRDNVYAKNLQGNVWRDPQGREQGITNDDYIRTVFNETGSKVQQLWGIGDNPNRRRGALELNPYSGTDEDLNKFLDSTSGLVRGSKISKTQGGYSLDPSTKAQFESLYPGIVSYLNSGSGETNTPPLEHLAGYFGNDWRNKLDKPAAQALEDKMYQSFATTAFKHQFKLSKAKGGNAFGGNEAQIQNVEAMARAGELENPDQVLKQIESDRRQYIQQEGKRYIVSRLMGRQYADSAKSQTQSLNVVGAGSERAAAKDHNGEKNYDYKLRNGDVDGLATSVRGVDKRGSENLLQVSAPVDVVKDRNAQYVGKPLTSAGFGRQIVSLGNMETNLLGNIKHADQFRVLSYDGDLLRPSNTSPELAQAQQQFQQAQSIVATLGFKKQTTNLLPSETAQLKQAQSQLATAQASMNTLTETERRNPYHKLTVVVPRKALEENNDAFSWQDQDGTTKRMFEGAFGVDALYNVYQSNAEATNPHGIRAIKLTDAQKKALGFDPDDDDFMQLDVAADARTQDMLNQSYKGVGKDIQYERQVQRAAELNNHVQWADALKGLK
jgi:hypothetical protein